MQHGLAMVWKALEGTRDDLRSSIQALLVDATAKTHPIVGLASREPEDNSPSNAL